jgi:hypothetical protein
MEVAYDLLDIFLRDQNVPKRCFGKCFDVRIQDAAICDLGILIYVFLRYSCNLPAYSSSHNSEEVGDIWSAPFV